MPKLKFLNANGDFVLTDADQAAETYFPLANEGGIISSITPRLAGDCKTGQDTFLLAACSEQTLHESRATRNFWAAICRRNAVERRRAKRGPAGGALRQRGGRGHAVRRAFVADGRARQPCAWRKSRRDLVCARPGRTRWS